MKSPVAYYWPKTLNTVGGERKSSPGARAMMVPGADAGSRTPALYTICVKAELVHDFVGKLLEAYEQRIRSLSESLAGLPYRDREIENLRYIVGQLEFLQRKLAELREVTCTGGPAAPYQARSLLDQIYYRAIVARQKLPTHLVAKLYDLYLAARELL